jgi:hypothetical protein
MTFFLLMLALAVRRAVDVLFPAMTNRLRKADSALLNSAFKIIQLMRLFN